MEANEKPLYVLKEWRFGGFGGGGGGATQLEKEDYFNMWIVFSFFI